MPIHQWTGSGYREVFPGLYNGQTPKAAYVYAAGAWRKVWEAIQKAKWVESFTTSRTGYWDGFASGSSAGAAQASGAATVASLGYGGNTNTYQAYQNPTNTDDQYLRLRLQSPPGCSLDMGAAGAALYVRLRATKVFGGDSLEFRLRGNGELATITSVNGVLTTRQTTTVAWGPGDDVTFKIVGDKVTVTHENTGQVLHSLTVLPSWGVPTGPANRYAAMTQQSNHPWFQAQWACFAVNRWELGDA